MNTIIGKVVAGKGKAKDIGFPTANVLMNDLPDASQVGLWAGIAKIRSRHGEWNAVANILEKSKIVEIHFINANFAGIYDEIVEFELVEKMEYTNSMKTDIEQFKTCSDCVYCVHQDYGYSNWTVEGTTSECSLSKREDYDLGYRGSCVGELFAINCGFFKKGEATYYNVDDERPA